MAVEALTIDIDDHALLLSADRAAFDPRTMSLFIADTHFCKNAVFRARGIPVPVGATGESLARLDALVAANRPESIVFLGDLLHARESHADETLTALHAWRARHRQLRLVLVEGNHDRHAGMLPAAFDIELVKEPYRLGPWALCHRPQLVDDAYALAGHEHPVYRLATRIDSARLPCFRFGARLGVLPAFGAFTGGFEVNGDVRSEAIYVVAGERVFGVRCTSGGLRRKSYSTGPESVCTSMRASLSPAPVRSSKCWTIFASKRSKTRLSSVATKSRSSRTNCSAPARVASGPASLLCT